MYDKIAQLRVVDGALRRRLPGLVGFSVARIDADDIKSGEVATATSGGVLSPPPKHAMQKLLGGPGNVVGDGSANAAVGRCCVHALENLFDRPAARPCLS